MFLRDMNKFNKNKSIWSFCVLIVMSTFALSGCSSGRTVPSDNSRTARSETYQSSSSAVADSGLSPLEQHMRARRMVDPGDTSPTHRYTYLAENHEKRVAGRQAREILRSDGTVVVPGHKPRRGGENAFSKLVASLAPADAVGGAVVKPESKPVVKTANASQSASGAILKPSVKPRRQVAKPSQTASYSGKGGSVTAVRVGKHPDKTRLVLDVSAKPDFNFEMDDRKNVLVVKLPGTGWSADTKRVFSSHPLLLAYLAKPTSGGGTFLAIKMKKKAKLLFKSVYPPGNGKGYRIVLDVAPA